MPTFQLFRNSGKTPPLKSLSKHAQEVLQLGIELYDDACFLYTGFKVQRTKDYRKQMHAAVKSSNKSAFQAVTRQYAEQESFDRYAKGCRSMRSKKFWRQVMASMDAKHHPVASQVQADWQTHGKFAHYSSQALLYIADEVLPTLIDYVTHAREELEQQATLNAEFVKAYRRYLDDFAARIEIEKQRLSLAMVARFEAAAKSQNPQQDDVLFDLQQHLQEWQALKNVKPPLTTPRQHFIVDAFVRFQQFIIEFAGKAIVARLQKLSWFAPILGVPMIRIPSSAQSSTSPVTLVPVSLWSWFKPRPARWPRLFPGRHYRHTFFQEKTPFLFTLKAIDEAPCCMSVEAFPTSDIYNALEASQMAVETEIKDSQQQQKRFRRFYHRKTQAFIVSWQKELSGYQQQVFNKKIEFAGHLVDLAVQATERSPEAEKRLEAYLSQLKGDLIAVGLDPKAVEGMQERLQLYPVEVDAKTLAMQLVEQLQAGKTIAAHDLQFLLHYYELATLNIAVDHSEFMNCVNSLCDSALAALGEHSLSTITTLGEHSFKPLNRLLRQQYLQLLAQVRPDADIPEEFTTQIPLEETLATLAKPPVNAPQPKLSALSAGIQGRQGVLAQVREAQAKAQASKDQTAPTDSLQPCFA